MKVTIDRIEGGFLIAELENGEMAKLDRVFCPQAREGDIVEIRVLEEETAERKKRIEAKMKDLFV